MKITGREKAQIAPEMFGLFFEDINFAADGGLYAEMIENRSFEAKEAFGIPGKFYTVADYDYAWSAMDESARLQVVEGCPLSEVNPHYLRFTAKKAKAGFGNKAYDGITLKKGLEYKLSFYARCVQYSADGLEVRIEKDGSSYGACHITLKKAVAYAPYCDVEPPFTSGWTAVDVIAEERRKLDLEQYAKESEWVRYEAVLMADADVRGAQFVMRLDDVGVVEFDLISMIPSDAVAGIFRRDLFEALQNLKPGFIRFPGGCIVEGISLANRYRWKQTVGDLKDRKYIPNLWAFNDSRDETDLNTQRLDAHYGQSYGIGFYEYFLLCELLGAKPLPVVGIGAACQFRSDEMLDWDDPKLAEYVKDALDLVEFANGTSDTKWGALRAKMGHPEPFGLELLAVGNEQWETTNLHLFKRLDAFEAAIHAKYPDIKLLGTAGPGLDLPMTKTAWEYYRSKPESCYAVDEHYYVSPQWMYERITQYDDYPRQVGVFAGEYAAHPANRGNNMEGALAEAAFMTGLEKNADVVKLASYAPLFNRIGHSQWKPDMIWFDDEKTVLTPNYYVQMLYTNHLGNVTIDLNGEDEVLRESGIYVSLSKRSDGTLILKAANCSNSVFELPLVNEHNEAISTEAVVTVLKAAGEEPKDLPQPSCLEVTKAVIKGKIELQPQTFTVMEF